MDWANVANIGSLTQWVAKGCAYGAGIVFFLSFEAGAALLPFPEKGEPAFRTIPQTQYDFEGRMGERIRANVENWLLRAPDANPGMVQMFLMRDRAPRPNLVPWAGEFVGKYLISAVQALRLSSQPELKRTVARVVERMIAAQAEDGYLGPFSKEERLKGHWDLWGHYHVIQGLLMWYDYTSDESALNAARKAVDLICKTYLDSDRRVLDAGSHEMNMAVIHGLGRLYRTTRDAKYFRLMEEIRKDWERAGDYYRTGLDGVEFFESPRPRWESLHDLQGLTELYLITGDSSYRRAFLHHWQSLLKWDRRNTGGFSSGEQATGNPYSPTAIETCSTIAWMETSMDALRLTGDASIADELEISTYNAVLGAQHPSGRWWTYSTPMDGVREASAHAIVFQARAGASELNCCSVNGPRGLGMLSEWGIMRASNGLVVNFYASGNIQTKLADNTPVALEIKADYPISGKVDIRVQPLISRNFRLYVRIPGWSRETAVKLNGKTVEGAVPGRYLEMERTWRQGDTVALELDMHPRIVTGDRDVAGKISIYRGPLLLAYDQRFNSFDERDIPAVRIRELDEAKPVAAAAGAHDSPLKQWILLDVPAEGGRSVRLCDFASAGVAGTRYRSWLPASAPPPPQVVLRTPRDGAAIAAAGALFQWTGPQRANELVRGYQLMVSETRDFSTAIINEKELRTNRLWLAKEQLQNLQSGKTYFWRVVASNDAGRTDSILPVSAFTINPQLPVNTADMELATGGNDVLVSAPLREDVVPGMGELLLATNVTVQSIDARDGVRKVQQTDGLAGGVVYSVRSFPEEEYSAAVKVMITHPPSTGSVRQILSAWTASMDDPLRICLEGEKIFARIESGQGYSTEGYIVQPGKWYSIAAVKRGSDLRLYVDGKLRGQAIVPLFVRTRSTAVALGANPRLLPNEFLAAQFTDFRLYGRALTENEIREISAGE